MVRGGECVNSVSAGGVLLTMPSMSATGGAAGPATSGSAGASSGNYYGNGLTVTDTPVWIWVVLIVFAIVMLLIAL